MTYTVLYGCPECGCRFRLSSTKAVLRKTFVDHKGGAYARDMAQQHHAREYPNCGGTMKWRSAHQSAA